MDRFPQEAELTDLVFRKTVRRRRLGDYELLDEIGHGGMGVVYRARQVFLNQLVAIKILSQHYHSDAHVVSRFRREMRMIGGLHHPNIVQALNAGETGDTLYLVMEYVDGFSIQQLVHSEEQIPKLEVEDNPKPETMRSNIQTDSTPGPMVSSVASSSIHTAPSAIDISNEDSEPVLSDAKNPSSQDAKTEKNWNSADLSETQLSMEKPTYSSTSGNLTSHFPWDAAAEVVRQTAFGLTHAFEQGLVHRDIKPANIMVTKKGVVKILDLGLGKFRAESQQSETREAVITQYGAAMGTVDYMAPEQWENATNVDVRADIYSLGCTLFFMLTGRAPFETQQYNSQRKKLIAHLEGDIPNITDFRDDCPPEFIAVFQKMVAKEPDDRFQTPEELLKAMTPFADYAALKKIVQKISIENGAQWSRSSPQELTPVFRNSNEDTLRGIHRNELFDDDSNADINLGRTVTRRDWQSDYGFSKSQFVQHFSQHFFHYFLQQLGKIWVGGYRSLTFLLISVLICIFVFRSQENFQDAPNESSESSSEKVEEQLHTENAGIEKNPQTSHLPPDLREEFNYPSPSQVGGLGAGTTPLLPSTASSGPQEHTAANRDAPQDVHKPDFPKNVRLPSGIEVLKDLIALPGLTGKWWFEETPWYLPFVREQIPNLSVPRKDELIRLHQNLVTHGEANPWMTISPFEVPYLNPNTLIAQDCLWELTKSTSENLLSEGQVRLILELRKTYDSQLQDEELWIRLQQHLSEFEKSVKSIPAENQKASDHHAIALLQHYLARSQNDSALAAKAKESYKTAQQKYAKIAPSGNPFAKMTRIPQVVEPQQLAAFVATQLQMVCLSDSMRLSFEMDRNLPAFEKEANELLKHEDMSNLFRIEFLTTYGNYSMLSGKSNDQLFERASLILEKSDIGILDHPLAAYLCERYAWSLVDQCQFIEAGQQFDKALRIRQNNYERKNPFAINYIFHDQLGIAIVKRYLGDIAGAKEQFAKVVKEIDEALKNTDPDNPLQQRYISDLKARLSNSLERYGDCILFGGAASHGTKLSQVSASDMKLAADLYDRSRNVTQSKAVWFVMSCKAVIIKSLLGQTVEAKQVLDELHCVKKDGTEKTNFASDRNRAEMLLHVAELAYGIREAEVEKTNLLAQARKKGTGQEKGAEQENKTGQEDRTEQGKDNGTELKNVEQKISFAHASLRRFLIQFESETTTSVKFRREPLETQLFCAEMLIGADLEAGNILLAREDLVSLETLLTHFLGYEKMRPFLYRFYDLAIRCYAESDLDQNAELRERTIQNQLKYVRQSRFWQHRRNVPESESDSTASNAKILVASEGTFFFYFNSDGGFAIFAPSDKNLPAERFPIPYTRQEIMNAANAGKTLELPKALADRINAERQADRNPVISYSDAPCWYHRHDALHDDDWPFNVPIRQDVPPEN